MAVEGLLGVCKTYVAAPLTISTIGELILRTFSFRHFPNISDLPNLTSFHQLELKKLPRHSSILNHDLSGKMRIEIMCKEIPGISSEH